MAGTAERHDGFVKLRYASFSFVRQSDLAAAQAVRMTLSLWLRWSNAIAVRLAAFRVRGKEVAILYFLSLDSDAVHASEDDAAFQTILRSFMVQPLPP